MKNLLFSFLLGFCLFSCSKDKDCDPGFTGSDCDQELVPDYMRVVEVTLERFPATDVGGAGWDLLDGPDLYIEILYNSTTLYTTKSNVRNNQTAQNQLWIVSSSVILDYPAEMYTFRLWDHDDTTADDYMGGGQFRPYTEGSKFPASILYDCAGCAVACRIAYEYVH